MLNKWYNPGQNWHISPPQNNTTEYSTHNPWHRIQHKPLHGHPLITMIIMYSFFLLWYNTLLLCKLAIKPQNFWYLVASTASSSLPARTCIVQAKIINCQCNKINLCWVDFDLRGCFFSYQCRRVRGSVQVPSYPSSWTCQCVTCNSWNYWSIFRWLSYKFNCCTGWQIITCN